MKRKLREVELKRLSRIDIENIAKKIIDKYKELPENQGVEVYRIEPELLLTKLLYHSFYNFVKLLFFTKLNNLID